MKPIITNEEIDEGKVNMVLDNVHEELLVIKMKALFGEDVVAHFSGLLETKQPLDKVKIKELFTYSKQIGRLIHEASK